MPDDCGVQGRVRGEACQSRSLEVLACTGAGALVSNPREGCVPKGVCRRVCAEGCVPKGVHRRVCAECLVVQKIRGEENQEDQTVRGTDVSVLRRGFVSQMWQFRNDTKGCGCLGARTATLFCKL